MDAYAEANRRRWDECVAIHLNARTGFYGVERFRAGGDTLGPIESAEIGDVAGKRLLHLQCHFGLDTLCLARRGAAVTGLDYAPSAIAAARALAAEAGLPATFVEGDVHDAPALIPGRFDVVYVTWGAINWLPDIGAWARVVAHFLAPGGSLYLLEGHPAALMLEERDGRLAPTYPYFQGAEPLAFDTETTYTGDPDQLTNRRSYEWIHSLSSVVGALLAAGLTLDRFAEHDRLAWQLFPCMLPEGDAGMFRMPDPASIPLAYSLRASRPQAGAPSVPHAA